MSKRVYRIAQLVGTKEQPGIINVSPATVWRWVKEGRFPKPFKLGAGTTVWDAADIEAFITAKREAA